MPDDSWTKALNYTVQRKRQLMVFLENPDVAMDTNHLEREIRSIPMGKKNWLFCWTELDTKHVGLIKSLISTCKLHDIDPNVYLTEVLQRVRTPSQGRRRLNNEAMEAPVCRQSIKIAIVLSVNDSLE